MTGHYLGSFMIVFKLHAQNSNMIRNFSVLRIRVIYGLQTCRLSKKQYRTASEFRREVIDFSVKCIVLLYFSQDPPVNYPLKTERFVIIVSLNAVDQPFQMHASSCDTFVYYNIRDVFALNIMLDSLN